MKMARLEAYFRAKAKCENMRGVAGRNDGTLIQRRCGNPASWEDGVLVFGEEWWCRECWLRRRWDHRLNRRKEAA